MRHAFLHFAGAFTVPGILSFLCQCASLSENDLPLAGGSGAGNPGGIVMLTVAATADAGQQGLGKTEAAGKQQYTLIDSSRAVTVTDKSGLQFILTEVTLSNIDVGFMLDSTEKPEQLLSSMDTMPTGLSTDTHSIVVDNSREFDALIENADSVIPSLRLPIARYTGVTLGFGELFGFGDFSHRETMEAIITMKGKFYYNETQHQIFITINCSLWPCSQFYRFGGGIFTLSPADTTHLKLQFNSKQWLSNVDIAGSLNEGYLAFDAEGALNIASLAGNRLNREIDFAITQSFVSSGKLSVY